jgi:hypothetical protein
VFTTESVLSAVPSDGGGLCGEPTNMNQLRVFLASFAISALPFARAESAAATAATDTTLRSGAPLRAAMGRAPVVIVAALDTDRNGVLSAAEIANAPTVLKALDANDDGVLSPTELRGVALARPANHATSSAAHSGRANRYASSFNVVFTLDANHDGDIQTMEIVNAVSSLKTLDRNGDGELTPDELQPAASKPRTMT